MSEIPVWSMLGTAFFALIAVIYWFQSHRIDKLEVWRETRPTKDEILTRSDHIMICDQRMGKVFESFDDIRNTMDTKLEKINNCVNGLKLDLARLEMKLDGSIGQNNNRWDTQERRREEDR